MQDPNLPYPHRFLNISQSVCVWQQSLFTVSATLRFITVHLMLTPVLLQRSNVKIFHYHRGIYPNFTNFIWSLINLIKHIFSSVKCKHLMAEKSLSHITTIVEKFSGLCMTVLYLSMEEMKHSSLYMDILTRSNV